MKKILALLGLIVIIFGGCHKKSDADYLAMANECVQKQDIPGAIAACENLVKEFPDGALAPQALYTMGRIYQDKLDKNLPYDGADRKAIVCYQQVVEKYPKASQAPAALFNIGFLYTNELNDLAKGKAAYEQYIKDYPNDQLVPAAKSELENLGLSPDEILNRKEAEQN
jgi:TolA-binding protein